MNKFEENKYMIFSVVLGKCSEALQAKLRGQDTSEKILEDKELPKLLKIIKLWILNQESSRSSIASEVASMAALHLLRQHQHEPLAEYQKRFVAASEVPKHLNIDLGKTLVGLSTKNLKDTEKKTRTMTTSEQIETAEERTLKKIAEYMFIAAADKAKYANIGVYLENGFVAGRDMFPADVSAAYNFLENWRKPVAQVKTPHNDGCTFAQNGTAGPSRVIRDKSKLQCNNCGEFGHIKTDGVCKPEDVENWQKKKMRTDVHTANHMTTNKDNSDPDDGVYRVALCMTHQEARENTGEVVEENGRTETVMTHSFDSQRASVIPAGLDSISSVGVFGDRRLMSNICTTASQMTIVCNAGEVSVTKKSDLAGYGPVWFHPGVVANILLLRNVRKPYKVRYDSDVDDFFTLE